MIPRDNLQQFRTNRTRSELEDRIGHNNQQNIQEDLYLSANLNKYIKIFCNVFYY